MNEVFVSTHDLSVGFKKDQPVILFEHLNLKLIAGRLVCFMGPNGVGKSSLIRTLANLQSALKGSIEVLPEQIEKPLTEKLAIVLTERIMHGDMTVYELLSYGRYPYLKWNVALTLEDKRIIEESIDIIHISHLRNRTISELSDGQMQMVMIARALSQQTPVIILDEPTAHLDLNNRLEVMKLLRHLAHKMNKAVLVSTHELDLALQTADEVWLAGANKNILSGIPEDLVLSGAFDEIFQFKGFDLRTGKIYHEPHRSTLIHLKGEGHEYLWTKNALERSGYVVNPDEPGHSIFVNIILEEGRPRWILEKNSRSQKFFSLVQMIEHINSIDCEIHK